MRKTYRYKNNKSYIEQKILIPNYNLTKTYEFFILKFWMSIFNLHKALSTLTCAWATLSSNI